MTSLTFQRLNHAGQWETIAPATIRQSVSGGRSHFVVNYWISRVPCEAHLYGDELTMRVVQA